MESTDRPVEVPVRIPAITPDVTDNDDSKTNSQEKQSRPRHLEDIQAATLALHADEALEVSNDIAPPIHVSTTFRYPNDPEDLKPFYGREIGPTEYVYSRESSSNATRLESILSSLLKAPCVTYSSGLAAIHAIFVLLNPKRVSIGEGYHGTHGVFAIHQRLTGCKKLPLSCPEDALQAGDLICLETPVNPTGQALNIVEYAIKAHRRAGQSILGGIRIYCVESWRCVAWEWVERLRDDRLYLGSVLGSLEGWLGIRSVRTMELRVKRQSENARVIVEALQRGLSGDARQRRVEGVVEEIKHASLQTEVNEWLDKQMSGGYGPVFAVLMKSEAFAKRLPSKLSLFAHATSLGGVESLVEWRAMSDATTPKNLVRFSIGIEDAQDLLKDLFRGFELLLEEATQTSGDL